MPSSSRTKKQTQQPTFVFRGTVKKLKSATMDSFPIDDLTAVVRVDEALEAPEYLADYQGKDITVRISGQVPIKPGQSMIFHTYSLMSGDSVSVQSVSEEPIKDAGVKIARRSSDPVEQKQTAELRKRFEDADLVVFGKVVDVRLPAESRKRGAKAAGRAPIGRISEHNADWREAVIQVDNVLKGSHSQKRIVVRFPASTDIKWHSAPKFQPGQEGYFLLHQAETESGESKGAAKRKGIRTATARTRGEAVYTALHNQDFLPSDESEGIKSLAEK